MSKWKWIRNDKILKEKTSKNRLQEQKQVNRMFAKLTSYKDSHEIKKAGDKAFSEKQIYETQLLLAADEGKIKSERLLEEVKKIKAKREKKKEKNKEA